MPPPKPPVPLNGHCSVVYENTLFVYSADAFQSIELKEGAEWQQLDNGLAATGAQCVKAVPSDNADNAALFIVGGIPTDSSITNYPGLQKYSFKDKSWEWVAPVDWVTQNRQNHGATYLNSTSDILVYAGSQVAGDTGPSSATFLISTIPPHGVLAYSSNAPPSVAPIVLPWDDSRAIVLGGSDQNREVFTFGREQQWQDLGVDLVNGINQDTMQTTVIAGDDGSKVLEVYDLGSAPNVVQQVVLLGKNGDLASFATTVGRPSRTKRLHVDDWPEYNATYAPSTPRTGFSLATAPNGYAVISGGNTEDPLVIFDQRENTWLNTTALFSGQQAVAQDISSSSISSTPTAAPSSTVVAPPPASSTNNKSRMLTVLGATLGTIFGIAALLIIILLLLRWRREKQKRAQGDDYIEKDRLSFADRGADFMKEAGVSHSDSGRRPWQHSMNGSQSSLAIITGRAGSGHKRGVGPLGSDNSTAGLTLNKGPLGYNDPMEMSRMNEIAPGGNAFAKETGTLNVSSAPAKPIGKQRSSGWSRYFAGNEATNLANMESNRSTYTSDRTSSNSMSKYTDSRIGSQPIQHIAPLEVKFENQRVSRVPTGSPTLGHSRENLHGHKAELARAPSVASAVSSLDENDPHAQAWSPIPRPGWQDRPSSSAYTDSNRGSALPVPDENSSFYHSHSEDSSSQRRPRDTISALYSGRPQIPEGRESTVTVFPRGTAAPAMAPPHQSNTRGNGQNDMSWLNLGAGNS